MKGLGGLVDGSLLVILGILLGFVALTEGYVHFVGGRDGWVLSPSESYNHWAESTRFQINDTLVFSYQRGDSVLLVNETDYNTCNPSNPIQSLHGGYSVFMFDRSGQFYFISGIADRCYKGQKMIITVLALRNDMANLGHAASPFPSISLPPTGSILPPNAQPGGAFSPSSVGALAPPPVPGGGTGVSIAPAPISGGPIIGITPASAPTGAGIGIGPASGPAGPGGVTPAFPPNEPAPTDGDSAVSIGFSSILLGFEFVILYGVI
ncbi:Early nodulin-like protein 1 [Rhynchospora pubera]|uniref:Early nodulin-like protein 1 n=1 Tax=Rhynchospora pubera TaxID=906938 RepID=A0AAV8C6E6_9POAL|nr:Early nodulin-like protein 1 [Rhynchospora pubera]KAJ4797393.1 Early nodulin-like protein 1 [Rhynchospora pubera]